MEVPHGYNQLSSIEFHCILIEALLRLEHLVELTTTDKGHHEVETKIVLEQVLHANEERMVALEHDVFLQNRVVDLLVLNQNVFPNRFDGIKLLVFLQLCKEDFTECAPANYHQKVEIIESDILLLSHRLAAFHELGRAQLVNVLVRQLLLSLLTRFVAK